MKLFRLGLVTVLFNSNNVLEGFFQSLSIQDFKDYHLFIIDNTANIITDELISTLTTKYPISTFTHIKNATNVGVAAGNNQGIELSISFGSTHTLILNNDIEFDQSDLLNKIYTKALTNETLIVPKILFYSTHRIWMAGGKFSNLRGSTKHIGEGREDKPKYNRVKYFNYAPTCFMLIDNNVFKKVGLMDEKYFVYYDDSDFILRAIKMGNRIYYMPELVILHKVSSSTGGTETPFSVYYSNRNRIYFIRKNYTGINFLVAIAFVTFTRVVKYLQYDTENRKKLVNAIFDGFKM